MRELRAPKKPRSNPRHWEEDWEEDWAWRRSRRSVAKNHLVSKCVFSALIDATQHEASPRVSLVKKTIIGHLLAMEYLMSIHTNQGRIGPVGSYVWSAIEPFLWQPIIARFQKLPITVPLTVSVPGHWTESDKRCRARTARRSSLWLISPFFVSTPRFHQLQGRQQWGTIQLHSLLL